MIEIIHNLTRILSEFTFCMFTNWGVFDSNQNIKSLNDGGPFSYITL